jgi:hypothetical protein
MFGGKYGELLDIFPQNDKKMGKKSEKEKCKMKPLDNQLILFS